MKNDKLHVRESLFLHLSFLIGHLSLIICEDILRVSAVRARQEIRCAFWRERRAGRCEAAAAPLWAAARRPAGGVARSLHTAPGMLVARALPAGLGASSKMYTLFPDGPLACSLKAELQKLNYQVLPLWVSVRNQTSGSAALSR